MKKQQGQSWTVTEQEAGLRLDKWLAAKSRLGSRSRALDALSKGKVFLNDVEQSNADAATKLTPKQVVRIWMDRPGSAERRYSERRSEGLHLIYEDASMLVVNKPAGQLTVPLPGEAEEASLLDQIRLHLRSHRKMEPQVVHRIDRDTSGLVVFAKTPQAQRGLKEQFEKREAERIYLAIVEGHPEPPSGTWRDRMVWDSESLLQRRAQSTDGKVQEAICRYRVLERMEKASLIEVSLMTGKQHQIRYQTGSRGYPLVGEKKYRFGKARVHDLNLSRQALHAHRLKFRHPVEGRMVSFEVEAPEDFQRLLRQLRSKSPQ
jgi:23S rRNA pseudouridine1911/1915/1917 synthase